MSYAIIDYKKTFFTHIDEIFEEINVNIPKHYKKNAIKCGRKINRILKKYNTNKVILSKELYNDEIKKYICEKNNYIIDGNNMYKILLRLCILDICEIVKIPIQTIRVVLLVHEFSIEILNLVKHISKDVKRFSVISENKDKFERLADELLREAGITISLYENNYKTTLRCDFIINIDYAEDELKRYVIAEDTIIFSVKENIKELKKSFNGIIINDIDIYLNKEYNNFSTLAICEAQIYDFKRNPKYNEEKFLKSGYRINAYMGNNGIINENEFKAVFSKK